MQSHMMKSYGSPRKSYLPHSVNIENFENFINEIAINSLILEIGSKTCAKYFQPFYTLSGKVELPNRNY